MSTQGPVLICGAGPTGLVLAIALRKNGIPVRIIDKSPHPHRGERGNGVSPRSLELHMILGTSPKILEAISPIPLCRVYDPADGTTPLMTFPLMPSRESTPHIPQNNYYMLGQNYQEQILREYLEELGTTIEHSTELQTFTQTEDSVQVTLIHYNNGTSSSESFEVPWLVGSDGAHSVVRKTLGLEFLGETKEEDRMLIADIKINGPHREFMEQWGDKSATVFSRPSGQESNLLWLLFAGPDADVEGMVGSRELIIETFHRISKRQDIEFGDLISSAIYRPNIRMVKRMRLDRVFVLGDAAHCHPPAGGQGMNSSIQDAFNLGWKLSMVYRGIAAPKLLDSFDEERLPVIAAMLNKTSELMEKNIKSTDGISTKRSTDLFQLGVNYRDSSIVSGTKRPEELGPWPAYNPESETAALPGDRAPDAPSLLDVAKGKTTSIFSILSPALHTVIVFGEMGNFVDAIKRLPAGIVQTALIYRNGKPGVESESKFDFTLRDHELGHAYSGYNIDDTVQSLAVIIRPDGIIGARVANGEGVSKYFDLILI